MTSPISTELGQLLALRRVRRGHVTFRQHNLFVDHGCPVPGYLRFFLRELLDEGHLCLSEQRAECDHQQVLMTLSGDQLHASLENSEG